MGCDSMMLLSLGPSIYQSDVIVSLQALALLGLGLVVTLLWMLQAHLLASNSDESGTRGHCRLEVSCTAS